MSVLGVIGHAGHQWAPASGAEPSIGECPVHLDQRVLRLAGRLLGRYSSAGNGQPDHVATNLVLDLGLPDGAEHRGIGATEQQVAKRWWDQDVSVENGYRPSLGGHARGLEVVRPITLGRRERRQCLPTLPFELLLIGHNVGFPEAMPVAHHPMW